MKRLNIDKRYSLSDSDINHRAKQVLLFSKNNNHNSVIDIFEVIALPFYEENYKRKIFERIFNLANIDAEWNNSLGFIIFSKNRTLKTVVSHMDLIPKFNIGFSKDKVYKVEDNKLIGALDNTFTNAVLINHILNNQHEDTTYLFTLDEETTQHSMRDYMKAYGNEQFIINLDVTNDGWDNNMSIEYDEPCWEICKQINNTMDNPFITVDRVGDDFDEVIKARGYGFSYCIPTKKNIHSYNNYTLIEKIKPYMEGLDFLIDNIDLSSYSPNIDYLSIEEALRFKSLKKMKKKDVPKINKVDHYDLYNNDNYSEINLFSKLVYNIALSIDDYYANNIEDLVSNSLYTYQEFTEEEFSDFISEELFNELLYVKLITHSVNDYYVFNIDIVNDTNFKIYEILSQYSNIDSVEFFKLITLAEVDSFSYEELLSLEENGKIQPLSEPINIMIRKGYIRKSKKDDIFYIL